MEIVINVSLGLTIASALKQYNTLKDDESEPETEKELRID